ncbi:hypothetical protein [Micromonospora avicenniae]|uniref:hypothetical protein n=1 Tax=Micromonospora avicenniae TaxID=1198245 RepID=UPI00331D3D9F
MSQSTPEVAVIRSHMSSFADLPVPRRTSRFALPDGTVLRVADLAAERDAGQYDYSVAGE